MSITIKSFTKQTIDIHFAQQLTHALNFKSAISLSNAQILAQYSKLSYKSKDVIVSYLRKSIPNFSNQFKPTINPDLGRFIFQPNLSDQEESFKNFEFFDSTRTQSQAFGYETESNIVVAFRGTEPSPTEVFLDYVIDLTLRQVDWMPGYGQVHQGFLAAFTSLAESIEGHFWKAIAAKKNCILTGHSLGGALATLFAAYIRQKHHLPVMLYTFGSPRVGDSAFSKKFNQSGIHAFRIHNSRDLISKIPPPHANARLSVFDLALLGAATGGAAAITAYALTSADFDDYPYQHIGRCFCIHEHMGGGFSFSEVEKEQIVLPCKHAGRHMLLGKELLGLFKETGPISGITYHSINKYADILNTHLKNHIDACFSHNKNSLIASQKALVDTQIHLNQLKRPQPGFARSSTDVLHTHHTANVQPVSPSPEIWEMQTRITLRARIMALENQIRYYQNPEHKQSLMKEIGLQGDTEDQETEFRRFTQSATEGQA